MKIKFRGSKSEETWPGIILVYLFPHPLNLISLSLSLTHTLSPSLSCTHTLYLSLSSTHTLSLSLSHTRSLILALLQSIYLARTHITPYLSLSTNVLALTHFLTFLPSPHHSSSNSLNIYPLLSFTLSIYLPFSLLHSYYLDLCLSFSLSQIFSQTHTSTRSLSLSFSIHPRHGQATV